MSDNLLRRILTRMLRFVQRTLLKFFVREKIVLDKEKYPYYDKLILFGEVTIVEEDENGRVFVFRIKRDKINECNSNLLVKCKCKRYTVELIPLHDDVNAFYRDKIMLAIKIGGFKISNSLLISFLVDTYVDKLRILGKHLERDNETGIP